MNLHIEGENNIDADIAIIGMTGRFPGAPSIDKLWDNLRHGRDGATWFSDEELLAAGVPAAILARKDYVRANQILSHPDHFDADFFSMPQQEAETIDPQQRLLLECAQEVFERAGYDPHRYKGSVGVFVGVGLNTYLMENLGGRFKVASMVERYQLGLANDKDFAATRISYKLNLRGPSMSIGTACSTSLVALHTACLNLLTGQCDMALAGAACVRYPQVTGYVFQEGMILSPDGHCRAFDDAAQGTVLGDGVAMVLVKRMADALADHDNILATIKASAVNNDGSVKGGYTAPSVEGQASVIAEALATSGVSVDTIGYVEAHGTGTHLGDPVEIAALSQAFARWTDRKQFCGIGSIKTNIGHLDVAAGFAGLIKTVLMLEHGEFVPSLNFERPNSEIDFAQTPFRVVEQGGDWVSDNIPRRACVSAFGIGGTNAHVILQQAPPRAQPNPPRECELLLLSARSTRALDRVCRELAQHLRKTPDVALNDVAHTLATGRLAHKHRYAVISGDPHEAGFALALSSGHLERAKNANGTARIAFFIRDLTADAMPTVKPLLDIPSYRRAREACIVAAEVATANDAGPFGQFFDDFANAFALGRLLLDMGIRPNVILGEGYGELVAACLVGAMDLPTAVGILRGGDVNNLFATSAFRPVPSAIRIASTRTGRWLEDSEIASPVHWRAMREHNDINSRDFSIGADIDSWLIVDSLSTAFETSIPAHPAARANSPWRAFLDVVARLWMDGLSINVGLLFPPGAGRVVLPTYPFERKRCYVDSGGPAVQESTVASLLMRVLEAESPLRARHLIISHMQRSIGDVLGLPQDAPPSPDKNLLDLGLDSLVLIELAAKLGNELGISIPASSFVEYPTITTFSDNVARLLEGETEDHAALAPAIGVPIREGTAPTARPDTDRRSRRNNLWAR